MTQAVLWGTVAVLGCVGGGAAVYTVSMYVTYFWWRHKGVHRHPGKVWRALVFEGVAAFLIFLLGLPSIFKKVVRLNAGTRGMTPVLCVPGYTQNWGNFVLLAAGLAKRGCGPIYSLNLTPRFGPMGPLVPQFTQALRTILEETQSPDLDVVCHSMGGLVVRLALTNPQVALAVRRVVTLGTPHHGTLLARFGLGHNAAEMQPGSAFLLQLPRPPPNLHSVWSTCDAVVAPPHSAACASQETVMEDLGHLGLLLSPRVWQTVAQALTSLEPPRHVTPETPLKPG